MYFIEIKKGINLTYLSLKSKVISVKLFWEISKCINRRLFFNNWTIPSIFRSVIPELLKFIEYGYDSDRETNNLEIDSGSVKELKFKLFAIKISKLVFYKAVQNSSNSTVEIDFIRLTI